MWVAACRSQEHCILRAVPCLCIRAFQARGGRGVVVLGRNESQEIGYARKRMPGVKILIQLGPVPLQTLSGYVVISCFFYMGKLQDIQTTA